MGAGGDEGQGGLHSTTRELLDACSGEPPKSWALLCPLSPRLPYAPRALGPPMPRIPRPPQESAGDKVASEVPTLVQQELV